MRLYTIETGLFKLDGGAMFGVVPKVIWNELNRADERNLCTWAMRCLLIESGNRLILIDTGIGNKQSEKFFSHYQLHGSDTLDKSLRSYGFHYSDITDVVLTHLHFDHCGGCVTWNTTRTGYELAFPNAIYWVHIDHWTYAESPNAREKASFLTENIHPIKESGHLKFIDSDSFDQDIQFKVVNGHTGSMILPVVQYKDRPLIFCADLIPSSFHIPIHYVMGYDIRPLVSMQEKFDILQWVYDQKGVLFFEHDPRVECGVVERTEKGFKLSNSFRLNELI